MGPRIFFFLLGRGLFCSLVFLCFFFFGVRAGVFQRETQQISLVTNPLVSKNFSGFLELLNFGDIS